MTPDPLFYIHARPAAKQTLAPQYRSNLTQKEVWVFHAELTAQGYTKIEVRKMRKK